MVSTCGLGTLVALWWWPLAVLGVPLLMDFSQYISKITFLFLDII